MDLMVNPVITDFQQDVNGDIKMLKIGQKKEDAYANIIGQAEGGDLDNNKTATINVSAYTEPVEILPTEGKDGMKKATVTLSNIPSAGSTLYAWKYEDGLGGSYFYYTLNADPTVGSKVFTAYESAIDTISITAKGENTITIEGAITATRDDTSDISLT